LCWTHRKPYCLPTLDGVRSREGEIAEGVCGYVPTRCRFRPSKKFSKSRTRFVYSDQFQNQVNSLIETIKKMGNPFSDDFPELVKLDSRNCVDESVAHDLFVLEETGIKQYEAYVRKSLRIVQYLYMSQ